MRVPTDTCSQDRSADMVFSAVLRMPVSSARYGDRPRRSGSINTLSRMSSPVALTTSSRKAFLLVHSHPDAEPVPITEAGQQEGDSGLHADQRVDGVAPREEQSRRQSEFKRAAWYHLGCWGDSPALATPRALRKRRGFAYSIVSLFLALGRPRLCGEQESSPHRQRAALRPPDSVQGQHPSFASTATSRHGPPPGGLPLSIRLNQL